MNGKRRSWNGLEKALWKFKYGWDTKPPHSHIFTYTYIVWRKTIRWMEKTPTQYNKQKLEMKRSWDTTFLCFKKSNEWYCSWGTWKHYANLLFNSTRVVNWILLFCNTFAGWTASRKGMFHPSIFHINSSFLPTRLPSQCRHRSSNWHSVFIFILFPST